MEAHQDSEATLREKIGEQAGELGERDARIRELEAERERLNELADRRLDGINQRNRELRAARSQEEVYRQQLADERKLSGKLSVQVHNREQALQQVRDLIEGEEGKPEDAQRLHLLVEQIDDAVRGVLGEAVEPGATAGTWTGHGSSTALDFEPGAIAGMVGKALGYFGVKPIKFERPGLFRGFPTEDGYRFERIGDDLGADASRLDEIERLMRETKAEVEKAEARRREVERIAIARGNRVEELQALVDEIVPNVQTLVAELAGTDPAWWVKATRALGELDRWSQSPLVTPPEDAGGMSRGDGLGGDES